MAPHTLAAPSAYQSYVPIYHNVTVTGAFNGPVDVHYVQAGHADAPTLLLLHGFPSSSNQFRDFIPMFSDSYNVIAPDFPGFGLTTRPKDFVYTFDNLAAVINAWLVALNITSYAMYIFDYGAPVGLRIALEKPEQVKALISQNGNAYVEGFGYPHWDPIMALWNTSDSKAARDALAAAALTFEGTEAQYTTGVPEKDLKLINPQAYNVDYLENVAGPENQKRQLDLLYDYRTNPPLYPKFQQYFKDSKVPILAVWGKNDPSFIPPGAEKFAEIPNAVVKFVDAGHFALETKRWEIARIMREWLKEIKY